MKPKNWNIKQVGSKETKISDERHEQLLAEVGEILYKRLCQLISNRKSLSTEPDILKDSPGSFK